MGLADDLKGEVKEIFATVWKQREGKEVPDAEDVGLGNDAVSLDATVLYADLAESTNLVNAFASKPHQVAEIYKAYLHCAAKVIRARSGVITSYDGDRVMGVFIGGYKNTSAAKAALNIAYCVKHIINPQMHVQYPDLDPAFEVRQAVGVDTSQLFIVRTGIRGSNDLVWIGRSANYAAKLCGLRDGAYSSWITKDVYDKLDSPLKVSRDGRDMWEKRAWTGRGIHVYRSNWSWEPA